MLIQENKEIGKIQGNSEIVKYGNREIGKYRNLKIGRQGNRYVWKY